MQGRALKSFVHALECRRGLFHARGQRARRLGQLLNLLGNARHAGGGGRRGNGLRLRTLAESTARQRNSLGCRRDRARRLQDRADRRAQIRRHGTHGNQQLANLVGRTRLTDLDGKVLLRQAVGGLDRQVDGRGDAANDDRDQSSSGEDGDQNQQDRATALIFLGGHPLLQIHAPGSQRRIERREERFERRKAKPAQRRGGAIAFLSDRACCELPPSRDGPASRHK